MKNKEIFYLKLQMVFKLQLTMPRKEIENNLFWNRWLKLEIQEEVVKSSYKEIILNKKNNKQLKL